MLYQKGHRILQRNLKTEFGEIDILTEDGPTVVLVEVKTTHGRRFGLPQELVRPAKQRKLRQLGRWLEQKYPNRLLRIDVVAIDLDDPTHPVIEHLENVLQGR